MARVKYSALIERISGKIGSTIFQENVAGPIIRGFCPPVNRNTIRQQKPKLIVNEVQTGWQLLSELQRDTWQGWSQYMRVHQRNNTGLFINGHQAYLRVNSIRRQYSLTLLNDPQFNKCDAIPVEMELRLAGPNLFVDFDRPMVGATEFAVLFITIPLPVTWNNPQGRLKLVEFVTTNAPTKNITSEYESLYGFKLVAGNTVFIKYTNIDKLSGQQFPYKTVKQTL